MKSTTAVSLFLSCLCCIGCSPVDHGASGNHNTINFSDLRVGQINRYVSFTIANDTVKTYGKDTAYVEVSDTFNTGFVFFVYFSPGSMSYLPPPSSPGPRYGVRIINDTCSATLLSGNNLFLSQLVPSQNLPLSFVDEGILPFRNLSPSTCNSIINQSFNRRTFNGTVTGCRVSIFYFDSLKIVIDNSAYLSGGFGYARIFAKTTGFLYTMSFSPYSTSKNASGWEILP
jgi:hypothetical protein